MKGAKGAPSFLPGPTHNVRKLQVFPLEEGEVGVALREIFLYDLYLANNIPTKLCLLFQLRVSYEEKYQPPHQITYVAPPVAPGFLSCPYADC